jgi:hypothetical protein
LTKADILEGRRNLMKSAKQGRRESPRVEHPESRLERYALRVRENPDLLLAIKESIADVDTPGLTADEFRKEFLSK